MTRLNLFVGRISALLNPLTYAFINIGAPILIFDDSSSALDQATDGALRKALGALSGVTTFIVSQRIVSVRDADKILVLHNGELVGCGNHEALMKHCRIYREIYGSQFSEDAASRQKGGKR